MAQSVRHLTLAQVTTLWSVSSGPTSGSVLTAQSREPASDSVSPSLMFSESQVSSFSLCSTYSSKIFQKEYGAPFSHGQMTIGSPKSPSQKERNRVFQWLPWSQLLVMKLLMPINQADLS